MGEPGSAVVDTAPSRPRILHVITRLDRGGSAENTLLTVLHQSEDYDVTLAHGPSQGGMSPTLDRARDAGVRIVEVPGLIRSPHPWHDLLALMRLRRLSQGVDLIHTHTSKAGILGRMAGRMAGVRRIVHTPHGHVFYGYYSKPVTWLFVWLERWAARWCERIVALTDADLADHVHFGVAPASKFVVIHSGVDLQALDFQVRTRDEIRQDLQIPAEAWLVGSLGRLTAIKGQADLLRAVALLDPSTWVVLVGDGEEESALRDLAGELGIVDRVVFAGWRNDTGDLLRAMDLFAFPSLNEGMGKALVEAMHVGCPIVATAVGGVPRLITNEIDGLLVPARSPQQLAQSLCRLRDDAELRQRLIDAARVRARSFGVESMIQQIKEMYGELLSRRGPGR